ncbi:hypothetical protein H0H87_006859 [Tephrocybe sp. NHM501043]|nr:hypothetical protein H0H87_006859 [Tephrocybe sp. NHM501043]
MPFLAIIQAALEHSKLHVFTWEGNPTDHSTISLSPVFSDDVHLVAKGGLHEIKAGAIGIQVAMVAYLAPIIKHSELLLDANTQYVIEGPMPLFLIASGLRELQQTNPVKANELLKVAHVAMQAFQGYFDVSNEASTVRIPTEEVETFLARVAFHHRSYFGE